MEFCNVYKEDSITVIVYLFDCRSFRDALAKILSSGPRGQIDMGFGVGSR